MQQLITMIQHDQTILNTPNIPNARIARSQLPISLRTPDSLAPVRVACHRGDWRNYVENTLEAVESCIEMGADMVEVDVWRTKDGHLILMHDDTLDRTSNGHGRIADHTLQEIRQLCLKDGINNMTEYKIPTIEELFQLTKDRIIVNLDKADLYLGEVFALLCKYDMANQVIVKSETPYDELKEKWGTIIDYMIYMPVLNITQNTTAEYLKRVFAERHDLYEVNFQHEDVNKMQMIKKLAKESSAVLWINTIWPTTCGGHSDDRALKDKKSNWGYIVQEIGAGIMQTDRPEKLLAYLHQQDWRNLTSGSMISDIHAPFYL